MIIRNIVVKEVEKHIVKIGKEKTCHQAASIYHQSIVEREEEQEMEMIIIKNLLN
jgi:hypothetical protein